MNIKTIHYGQIHRGEFEQKILDCLTDKDQTVSQIRTELIRKGIKAPAPIIRERLDVFSHFNKIIKSEHSTPQCFKFRNLPKPAFKVGNKVEPINYEHTLASGCERYPHAYVVNVSPFQLISERGDMYWSCTVKPEGFRIISESIEMPKAVTERMALQGLLIPSSNIEKVCTCPSGDGSLQWPCPVHPPDDIHEAAIRHGMSTRSVRWPANAAGNFGCVQVPMEAAAEAKKMQQIANLIDAGVITVEESKVIASSEKFITGQWVVAEHSDTVWCISAIKTGMAYLESNEHPGWWCSLSKLRTATVMEMLKTIQANQAIIQTGGMVYDFGQPMHCKCEVQVNHAALPTIEEKYKNLKSLIRSYFEHISNIYDFGHGSHESFTKSRAIAEKINKIIEDEL